MTIWRCLNPKYKMISSSKKSKAWTMTWMLTPKKGCGDKLKGVSGISNTALVISTPPVIRITMDRTPLTRIK